MMPSQVSNVRTGSLQPASENQSSSQSARGPSSPSLAAALQALPKLKELKASDITREQLNAQGRSQWNEWAQKNGNESPRTMDRNWLRTLNSQGNPNAFTPHRQR